MSSFVFVSEKCVEFRMLVHNRRGVIILCQNSLQLPWRLISRQINKYSCFLYKLWNRFEGAFIDNEFVYVAVLLFAFVKLQR